MTAAAQGVAEPAAVGSPGERLRNPHPSGGASDIESVGWIRSLSGGGSEREAAVERLHALLLRATRFEVTRRRRPVAGGDSGELDDLAMEAADNALIAVLSKLHAYRGTAASRTWAYKFALPVLTSPGHEVSVRGRQTSPALPTRRRP